MSIWNILGIEPTKEPRVIKRAYASKAKECHPDDAPEKFLQLRSAYEQALAYAQGNKNVTTQTVEIKRQSSLTEYRHKPLEEKSDQLVTSENKALIDFDTIFKSVQHNKMQAKLEKGALRTLLDALSDPKKRNNKQFWRDFVLSEEFLQEQLSNDEFLEMIAYFLTQQTDVPVENLPQNLYVSLLIAFNGVPDEEHVKTTERIAPLMLLMQRHPYYEHIEKAARHKELSLLRKSFILYHNALRLYPKIHLQGMREIWRSLLKNNYIRRAPEIYSLLAFFVKSHPNMPGEIYQIMHEVYDLENYHLLRRKQTLTPLYEALEKYRVEFVPIMAEEKRIASLEQQFLFGFWGIYTKHIKVDQALYNQQGTLEEAAQLLSSEEFLEVQFTSKVLNELYIFFSLRQDYIVHGLWNETKHVYQPYQDQPDVLRLLEAMDGYRQRYEAKSSNTLQDKVESSEIDDSAEIILEQQADFPLEKNNVETNETGFFKRYIGFIQPLLNWSKWCLTRKPKIVKRVLPESSIWNTLQEALTNPDKKDNKDFWREFILSKDFLQQHLRPNFLEDIVYYLEFESKMALNKLSSTMYPYLQIVFKPNPYWSKITKYEAGTKHQKDISLLEKLMKEHPLYESFANDFKHPDLENLNDGFYVYNSANGLYAESGFEQYEQWYSLLDNICESKTCLCEIYTFRLLAFFVSNHPDLPVDIYKIIYTLYKFENYNALRRKHILKPLYDALVGYRKFYISDAEKQQLAIIYKRFKKQFKKDFNALYKKYSNADETFYYQVATIDDADSLFSSEAFVTILLDSEVVNDLNHTIIKSKNDMARGIWTAIYNVYQAHNDNQEVLDLLGTLKNYQQTYESTTGKLWQ